MQLVLEFVGLSVLIKYRVFQTNFFVKFDDVNSRNLRGPLRLPHGCSSSVI